jgi:hypothetical protein
MTNPNVITNRNGQFSSATGETAVQAFAIRSLIVTLRLEAKTGIKMSRVSAKAIAKRRTGLKTNNAEKLCTALESELDTLLAQCEIVNE